MNREIDRLECWVFLAGCVLPDCPGKTDLTGFPNRLTGFSPVGCREGFLSKSVSIVLWLLLFNGGKVLEVFWSRRCFGEFLDKTGLTGFPNRSDQFPLPVERLSPTEAVWPVSETGLTVFRCQQLGRVCFRCVCRVAVGCVSAST
jgi:hypothetical protein